MTDKLDRFTNWKYIHKKNPKALSQKESNALFMEAFNILSQNGKREVNRQTIIDELVHGVGFKESEALLALTYALRNWMIEEVRSDWYSKK